MNGIGSLRAAVVGTGFIGPVHVEGLRRAGVDVVGILGSSEDKSHEAASKLQISRAYARLEDLLADHDVDCVHITSPNLVHFEQTQLALAAGKHVLCEKPLAMNSSQSAELVRLAKHSGRAAGVNYNIRYYPLCIEAGERRRADQLGTIHHINGSYAQDWLFHQSDFNWRVLANQGGPLRAVADIGTHWLDLVHSISGLKVQSVCADLHQVFSERHQPAGSSETFTGGRSTSAEKISIPVDTEDYGAVLIRFVGGARGTLWVSQIAAGRKNCLRWEIAAAKQSLSWNSESPNDLWIGHRDRPNETLIRDPALMHARAAHFANYPGGHSEGFPDTFKQLFRDFYASIADGSYRECPRFPTFADGHREIVLCEAILQSAQTRSWVDIDPSVDGGAA